MGTFDGDTTNDFMLPDGTSYGDPTTMTEEQAYAFGTQYMFIRLNF